MTKRSKEEWIQAYAAGHQHPVNRACHTVGIPMIALSVVAVPFALWQAWMWPAIAALFVLGWLFQFVGHAFERKPPEFFKDWRFLFVGLRWWFAKLAGRA